MCNTGSHVYVAWLLNVAHMPNNLSNSGQIFLAVWPGFSSFEYNFLRQIVMSFTCLPHPYPVFAGWNSDAELLVCTVSVHCVTVPVCTWPSRPISTPASATTLSFLSHIPFLPSVPRSWTIHTKPRAFFLFSLCLALFFFFVFMYFYCLGGCVCWELNPALCMLGEYCTTELHS